MEDLGGLPSVDGNISFVLGSVAFVNTSLHEGLTPLHAYCAIVLGRPSNMCQRPPPPNFPLPCPRFRSHPVFVEKSFADATETAWARNRLCLVYIAGERGGGAKAAKVDNAICKALADPEVGRERVVRPPAAYLIRYRVRLWGSCCCGCWSTRRPLYLEGAPYHTVPYHTIR